MSTEADALALGLAVPHGYDRTRDGDDAIRDNAIATARLHLALKSWTETQVGDIATGFNELEAGVTADINEMSAQVAQIETDIEVATTGWAVDHLDPTVLVVAHSATVTPDPDEPTVLVVTT